MLFSNMTVSSYQELKMLIKMSFDVLETIQAFNIAIR